MSDTVIKVDNLSKKYILSHQSQERYTALRDVMARVAKNLGKKLISPFTIHHSPLPALKEAFYALKDVSFEIKQGDRIGIIGRNGAGKSTLLKILSRIVEPTSGKIEITGRVASLLEVGTGFHPELTGRENIFLNGAILGMSRAEINRKFDAIVDFAETEKFLDTPVKRYSSGMYVRLAFAVAAHLEPEILIVDEVLAVGDVQFQKKCLGKMEDVAKEGRTVLFVSHNMAAIQQLTNKSILLHQGAVISNGSSVAVVAKYLQTSFQSTVAYDVRNKPRLYSEITSRDVEFCELTFDNTQTNIFSVGSAIDILVTIRGNAKKDKFRFSMTIFRIDGTPVGNFFGPTIHSINNNETAVFKLELRHLNLAPGKYCCALAMGIGNEKELIREFDIISDVLNFEVMFPSDSGTTGTWNSGWGSIIFDAPNIYKVQSN